VRAAYAWGVVILFTLVSWFANAAHPYTLGHHLDDRPSLWDYMGAHPISTAQAGLPSLALAVVAHLFLITRPRAPHQDGRDSRSKRARARFRKRRTRAASGPRQFMPVPAVLEQVRAFMIEAHAQGRDPDGREIGRAIGRHEATARKYMRHIREEDPRLEPKPVETVA
jgi:hypothetical protein